MRLPGEAPIRLRAGVTSPEAAGTATTVVAVTSCAWAAAPVAEVVVTEVAMVTAAAVVAAAAAAASYSWAALATEVSVALVAD